MKFKQIINVVGLVLLIALIVPFGIYAVPGAIGADHSFIVLSGSMEPEISPGDAVIVSEVDPLTITEGDIITFVRSEQEVPVTHRVESIELTETGVMFETKGDANNEVDSSLVSGENVIGEVTLRIPFIGYVIQAVNTTAGFILLVVLPFTLLALSELWSLLRAGKRSVDPDSTEEEGSGDVPAVGPEPVESAEPEKGIVVSSRDLQIVTGLLLLVVPYALYVALQMTTVVTITVAFAAVFSLLLSGALLVVVTRSSAGKRSPGPGEHPDRQDTEPVTDGGKKEGDE